MTNKITPASLGYRMPAEWEPHSATWLSWPHNSKTWPGQDMAKVQEVHIAMMKGLHLGEKVNLLVNDQKTFDYVSGKLLETGISGIYIHIFPTNDVWIRDYGPNFLVGSSPTDNVALNKWGFNAWGGKYLWDKDVQVGHTIAKYLGMTVFSPGIILEGGAIECNGQGVCITTEQCMLNKNRNPELSRKDIEQYLKDYLGVRQIIWCQGDVVGDDTDGHIDNLVRFVNADTVLCAWEGDPQDHNHKCLKENYEILKSAKDQNGKPFNVVRLPMPGYVGDSVKRLPASYANFYIGNKAVILPVYDMPNDKIALSLLQKFFPDREIVCVPSRTFIWGLGGIHCVTQQQPKG